MNLHFLLGLTGSKGIVKSSLLAKRLKFPRLLSLELTNACNSHCIMCPRDQLTRKIGYINRELAEEIFGQPTRVGIPRGFSGVTDGASSPVFATGVGLVLCGNDEELMGTRIFKNGDSHLFSKVLKWMKNFVDDFLG